MNALDIISPQLAPLAEEPFYRPVTQEDRLFEAAFERRLPVLLKGPTGCGKTRFVEYMAWKLKRPLVTVACHEDLTASDLVGRYLIVGGQTVWMEGPLSAAVRNGAICYLDEVVEARKDTMVLIHPLADSRRVLPVEKRGEWVHAAAGFMLVISYNPGYQSVLKDEGASTRLLVHAGNLIAAGIEPAQACRAAIAQAVTDDAQMLRAVHELFCSVF